ncbi:hypothetical protein, partial [Enterococcus sp. 7D2_DIV0200]|uniref:hypothetical protein n=1 Tax=Enterococcus sp. 7D2_DIV0200 TaxID=1834187 RepID=UPI001C39045D
MPIWIITEKYSKNDKRIYLQLGSNGVISKSIGMKELLLTMRDFIQITHFSCNSISTKVVHSFVLNVTKGS